MQFVYYIILFCLCMFMTVHGKWGLWSDLTSCTKSCGSGIKSSQRTCDNPAPQKWGKFCEGDARIDNKTCNSQKCPGTDPAYKERLC